MRPSRPLGALLLGAAFVSSSLAFADTSSIESRLEELERRQAEMFQQQNEEEGRVKPFLKNEILLGGYFETGIDRASGPHTEVMTNAPSHVLGLNIAARLAAQDRFVAQLQTGLGYTVANRHNDPRVTATPTRQYTTATAPTILAHAYYEHSFDTALNVQAGLGYVPFGITYHNREPMLFRRRGGEGQQMVSQSATQDGGVTSVGVAFPLWMGVHLLGSVPVGTNRLGYDAYTFTPTTNSKTLGGGGRLWFQWTDLVTLGVSGQYGDTRRQGVAYRSLGADADFRYQAYGLTLEYGDSKLTHGTPDAPKGFYVTPYAELFGGKWVVYAFVDYLDNPTNVTLTTGFPADPYKRRDVGAGVNWLPQTNLRFRLGYGRAKYFGPDTVVDPSTRDFDQVDLSTVIAF